jgi:hypothetical protein
LCFFFPKTKKQKKKKQINAGTNYLKQPKCKNEEKKHENAPQKLSKAQISSCFPKKHTTCSTHIVTQKLCPKALNMSSYFYL